MVVKAVPIAVVLYVIAVPMIVKVMLMLLVANVVPIAVVLLCNSSTNDDASLAVH